VVTAAIRLECSAQLIKESAQVTDFQIQHESYPRTP